MPLGVNENLAARQVLIQLKNNDQVYNRQIQRLSSGLRINAAADDPAGLVISEKYKLQTEGLGQAIKNAQDGISLTQTAEGALQEVSNQLRAMRNLAVHAANTGPNDAAAIAADQAQIASAIQTINRIAGTTQFGTRKLLDGSSGVTGSTTNANVTFVTGTAQTAGGTYAVNVTQNAVQGMMQSATALTVASVTGAGTANTTTSAGQLTFAGALVGATPVVVDVGTSAGLAGVAAAINNNSSLAAAGISASVTTANQLIITSDRLSGGTGAELNVRANTTELAGITGISSAGTTASVTTTATDTARIRNSELLTFSNGSGTSIQVTMTAGSTIRSTMTQLQQALDDTGLKVDAAFTTAGRFTFTNREFGSATTVLNTITSNRGTAATADAINSGIVTNAGTTYRIAASGLAGNTDGADVAGTLGGLNATGVGQLLTGNSGTAADGLEVKVTGNTVGNLGEVTVNQNSMTFQIGAFANQTVELMINDLRANMIGTTATGTSANTATVSVAGIDVTRGNGAGAQDAILILDAAATQISSLRATLGSFQKDTLESSVRNMMIAQQNIQTSQSLITDANMAEETLTYSRAQILQQTGLAMLTQANQAPQQLLSLFKG